jgi:uncharacterized protein (TIGR03083 family)
VHQVDRSTVVGALAAEYGLLTKIIRSLSQADLAQPSGCLGWTNADLIFHMLLDVQRALVTFNSPAIGAVDRDFVTYWKGFLATDEPSQEHARYVRINAASHRNPTTICARWAATAEAAIRNAQTANIDLVTTQGHILNIADFIATLVVEATVHHLDLVANLAGSRAPAPEAVAIATITIDGLLKAPRPLGWGDETYILKATGRAPLNEADRTALGSAGDRIPVFS